MGGEEEALPPPVKQGKVLSGGGKRSSTKGLQRGRHALIQNKHLSRKNLVVSKQRGGDSPDKKNCLGRKEIFSQEGHSPLL